MTLFNLGEQMKINPQKTENLFNTETMLPVSEIKNDTIIMKDGGLRAIMKIEGINLDLKNFDEQQIILEQYKRFLNGLGFPIQIVVRNNYLDLSNYLDYIKGNIEKVTNPTLKKTGEDYQKFLQDIDNKQGLIYEKSFYIVIPYYQSEKDKSSIKKSWFTKFLDVLNAKDSVEKIVERYRGFSKGKTMLDTRCNLITEGLGSIGINANRLNTSSIISVLFNYYNPLLHNAQGKI
ncbi:MAG TPA: hypothetical protein VJ892_01435 [Candidatus Absconditabacterales bacterium]|nr:hypothetical protein [Candidatus Absconditabacterales bacterium]